MEWLKTQKWFELDTGVFESACMGDQLEALKWLRSEGCPWNEWTCEEAAREWNRNVLRWAMDNDCPCDESNEDVRMALDSLGLP